MKRSFPKSTELDNNLTMANCLMLLSRGSDFDTMNRFNMTAESRVFECKTCNRQFSSFQALGGHRASHKKPRLIDGSGGDSQSSVKPKTHECSICGLEFAIGQALGGHMRRHRAASSHENEKIPALSISDSGPVVKKANSRRVLCLDLNLTPYENDLEFYRLGRKATATTNMVDCFL